MRQLSAIFLCIFSLVFGSCASRNEVEYTYDPVANIDALWRIIDEKYCYVDTKCDWAAVGEEYRRKAASLRLDSVHKRVELFDLMASMLDSLRDGHVNLYTPFDVSVCSSWYEGYPANYDARLLAGYIEGQRVAGGLYYNLLNDSIGYVRYTSFSNACGDGNLMWVMMAFRDCKGMILDVRQNGGGDMTNAEKLASPFFSSDKVVGYWQHKSGPGHEDFSRPEPQTIHSNPNLQWKRPVVVLSNRRCYSATNYFLSAMKHADNCLIIGGKSGGGGGMPLSYELPCGWTVRFSSIRMMDVHYADIEDGIEPDIEVTQVSTDRDDLIEAAVSQIQSL